MSFLVFIIQKICIINNMNQLKSAYELAGERIICSKKNKEDKKPEGWDFIDIPEFSDREDRVVEISGYTDQKEKVGINDTKFMDGTNMPEEMLVKSEESNTIHYGSDLIEACWAGNFMDYGGFARLNRTMVFGLSNRNVKMRVESEQYLDHVNEATRKQLEYFFNVQLRPSSPKIFGSTVPLNMSHTGKKVFYTMTETSDRVHKDYAEKMNLTDEIWVATKYGKKIMEDSNVRVPIFVMPLGVDIDRYKAGCGIMNFGSAMRQFKFLSVFRWSYRKGFDILIKAYLEEFSSLDDVSLLLVSRSVECPEDQGVERIIEDFKGIKSTVKKSEEEMPHIALYTKVIHEKNMPKVYNSCDAFALVSRGEGFGLPYMEAAATGLPVIASHCSGHSDFVNADNSYLIEPDGYIEASLSGRLSKMAKLCHFYEGQSFPNFGEDAVRQTREHMRYVYENRVEAKKKAEKLRDLVINNYTWDMAIDKVYDRLKEIQ